MSALTADDRRRMAAWTASVERRRRRTGVTVRPHHHADDDLADRVALALAASDLLTDADRDALDIDLRARSRAMLPTSAE